MVIRKVHFVIKLYKTQENGSGKSRIAVTFGETMRVKIKMKKMEELLR